MGCCPAYYYSPSERRKRRKQSAPTEICEYIVSARVGRWAGRGVKSNFLTPTVCHFLALPNIILQYWHGFHLYLPTYSGICLYICRHRAVYRGWEGREREVQESIGRDDACVPSPTYQFRGLLLTIRSP